MKRRNKFGAIRTEAHGITFDSKKESKRYGDLLLLEKAGVIQNLERQVKFQMIVNGVNCGFWKADHVYFEGNKRVVEDVKSDGTRTATYRLKKRIIEAIYGFTILEV